VAPSLRVGGECSFGFGEIGKKPEASGTGDLESHLLRNDMPFEPSHDYVVAVWDTVNEGASRARRWGAPHGRAASAATDHVTVVSGSRISIQGDKLQDIFRTVADRRRANNRRSRALPLSQPAARKDRADGTISAMAG
jgi:hypothetical protein